MTKTMTTSMIGKSVKTHLNFLPAASTAFRSFMLANLSILKSYFCYDDDDDDLEDHDGEGNDDDCGNFFNDDDDDGQDDDDDEKANLTLTSCGRVSLSTL